MTRRGFIWETVIKLPPRLREAELHTFNTFFTLAEKVENTTFFTLAEKVEKTRNDTF